MPGTPWVLAHQGAWDEILMLVVPVALALVAVRWANRRTSARRTPDDDSGGRWGDDPGHRR